MEFLFQLSHMAVTNIQDEIFDILTPLKISQQILGIMLCLEVPLFPFAVLMTELAHRQLFPQSSIGPFEESSLRVGPGIDLRLEKTTKPPPVFPVSDLSATISDHVFKNMNRRTAEQETAEYRSEKTLSYSFKNFCSSKFCIQYSIFNNQKNIFTH